MKIVIAPDSYKGSLTALEVAQSIRKGIHCVDTSIETVLVPMADGGEGTVQSLVDASQGIIVEVEVHDPLYRKVPSFYGIMGDGVTAVIEMAAASGLPMLSPDERNPLVATTYGTGELIKDALDRGCRNFIIGLGGSATNDAGCGMAQALGARFLDEHNQEIGRGGGELSKLRFIDFSDFDPRIKKSHFFAACDVDNPLCGEEGASRVYAKQKGAGDDDIFRLDDCLRSFASVVKTQLAIDVIDVRGAGAAGGLGAGVLVFLDAKLQRGVEIVVGLTDLVEKVKGADLVITGEGRMDFQTAFGKTPFGVARIAKQQGVPIIALCGGLGERYKTLYDKGFDGIFSIVDRPMTLQDAIDNADDLLANAAEGIMRIWLRKKKR